MSNSLLSEVLAAVSVAGDKPSDEAQSLFRNDLERELGAVGTSIAQLSSGNVPADVDAMQVYDAIVRVCAKHGVSIDMPEDPQWNELHGRLVVSLERFGTNDPGRNGDFWLVEDYFGVNEFRLIIINVGILTRAFVEAIQQVLASAARRYKVTVIVDDPHRGEYTPLEIFSDRVVELEKGPPI